MLAKVKVKVTLLLTVGRSVSLSVEPHLVFTTRYLLQFDSYGLLFWGSLSDERVGLSLVYAAGHRQRSLSGVRVIWDSWPYFTVSDLRLPFSSLPTTRRVMVEVFEPASTSWLTYIGTTRTTHYRKTYVYPASPLARWLLPSNGLGTDLEKTPACTTSTVVWRHRARVNVPSARCIAAVRVRATQNVTPVLLAACVGGVA
jgi:hypothetical protein